jgi:SecD/SecF fusion protein
MKPFLNRILVCALPVLVALIVVVVAYVRYANGQGGLSFKLGTDIVGGTILIYEIDTSKSAGPETQEGADKGKALRPEAENKAQQLAEKLKQRLDPADTFGITVRPVSNTRVEIILPTGGQHQIEAETALWQAVLADAEDKFPVERYTVSYDEPGRNVKLIGQVSAQHPDVDVAQISAFIDKEAPKSSDRKEWDNFRDNVVAEKWKPARYTAGRGNVDQLLAQILEQKEEKAKANPDLKSEIQTFVDNLRDKVKRLSLTTEGVAEVKDKISRVGSLKFLILANDKKDKDGLEAATKFITKAQERDEKDPRIFKNKQLHDDLENLAINGFPPPPLKKEGRYLVCLGEKYDTSENFSYSWTEMGPSFRKEHGLSDPRYDYADRPSAEKDVGELIPITDADIVRFFSEKWDARSGKDWEKDPSNDKDNDWPEKVRLLRGETVRNTKLNPAWISAMRYWYEGKPFRLPFGDMSLLGFVRKAQSLKATGKDRDKKWEYFVLTRDPDEDLGPITGEYLDGASVQGDEVHFGFRSIGGEKFGMFTGRNIGQPMGVVLDGNLRSVATIQSRIDNNGRITFGKNASPAEMNRTAQNLNKGALPASLKPEPVSENTMGPTLGADTIFWGSVSVLVAFLAVLAFMLFYYRFAGLVACVALFANLILTVAFMVLVQATFTLPGLAGLVLMLGMAVDANVLIYERLREERDRGASLALAIRNGYDRAFPTIIDTHLSSIFTAIVLYIVGNDQLKGFGISLTVGLIISLFTSLYMTRLLFDLWLAKGWLHKLSMLRFLSKPNIDFMAIRYYWFTFTIVFTLIGGALFIYRLDPPDRKGVLNIDFVGGTAYSAELVEPVEIGKLRDLFAEGRQDDLLKVKNVKPLDEKDGKASEYEITYAKDDEGIYDEDRSFKVTLTEPLTPERFQARAGRLQDVSVEQIFVGGGAGRGSAYFTVRTAEKSPDLVQIMIDRLMVEKTSGGHKDLLKKLLLSDYNLEDKNGKTALLSFTDPDGKPEFASKAQVARLLEKQIEADVIAPLREQRDKLKSEKVEEGTAEAKENAKKIKDLDADISRLELIKQQMELRGIGTDEGGRYRWMELVLTGLLDKDSVTKSNTLLKNILSDTSKEFQARPQPERLENFDSQLAQETQTRALIAIVASWMAILLYLWFRFGNWTFGLAAVLCLIHDLFFTLGIIALCHWLHNIPFFGTVLGLRDFKIDLQTVAALLTLVGYSVNDTIVVFDRIREVRGKNPELTPKMINDSVNQTLSRTLLTSLVTWLVVLVLYILGGEGVHLFAFVMVVGVIVGTYSSIYIASPLLLIFGEGRRPGPVRETLPAPTASPVA